MIVGKRVKIQELRKQDKQMTNVPTPKKSHRPDPVGRFGVGATWFIRVTNVEEKVAVCLAMGFVSCGLAFIPCKQVVSNPD